MSDDTVFLYGLSGYSGPYKPRRWERKLTIGDIYNPPRQDYGIRSCKVCGKSFNAVITRQVNCSNECTNSTRWATRARRREEGRL